MACNARLRTIVAFGSNHSLQPHRSPDQNGFPQHNLRSILSHLRHHAPYGNVDFNTVYNAEPNMMEVLDTLHQTATAIILRELSLYSCSPLYPICSSGIPNSTITVRLSTRTNLIVGQDVIELNAISCFQSTLPILQNSTPESYLYLDILYRRLQTHRNPNSTEQKPRRPPASRSYANRHSRSQHRNGL